MSESKLIYQKCGQCDNFFPPEYRECPYCYKSVEQPDFGNQPIAPSTKVKKRGSSLSIGGVILLFALLMFGQEWLRSLSQQAVDAEAALYAQSQMLYEARMDALYARSQVSLQEKLDRLPLGSRQAQNLQDQAQALYDAEARLIKLEVEAAYAAQFKEVVPVWARWLMGWKGTIEISDG